MSGIYIIGMEMPKNCDSCRIMEFEDTNCVPELFCGCPIVFKAHPQGEDHRPDYCPLVAVPNHGRLVDADALQLKLLTAESGKVYDYCYPCKEVLQAIKDSPTIIERETN